MIDYQERIVALEEARRISDETQKKILEHVQNIDARMNKYQGFIGSIWFIISCLGIFFSGWKYFHR
jgi:antibiotic biosynthesis monooxygenase (ABM) superfamily enzyme